MNRTRGIATKREYDEPAWALRGPGRDWLFGRLSLGRGHPGRDSTCPNGYALMRCAANIGPLEFERVGAFGREYEVVYHSPEHAGPGRVGSNEAGVRRPLCHIGTSKQKEERGWVIHDGIKQPVSKIFPGKE
jgi:hypothetical protein